MITKILTNEIIPGMIVAENIYNESILLIPKNTILTDRMITTLKLHSIPYLCILNEGKTEPFEHKQTTYSEKIKQSEEFKIFENNFLEKTYFLKQYLNDIVKKNNEVLIDDLINIVNSLIGNVRTGYHVFDLINNLVKLDDATYAHSLSVALICNIFGRWLQLSSYDINQLTIAGMLHDIGKLAIPPDILNKPGRLTKDEFEIIKNHTLEGYKVLENQNIDIRIKNTVLMHHEKSDGTGYPMKLKNNNIELFAKIVSIADIYDATTSARIYRGPMCPFEVINIFEEEGLQKFDPMLVMTFLNKIAETYLNSWVELSNGLIGEVVFINKSHLSRPIIQVMDNFIDLSTNLDISITSIIQ